VTDPPLSGIWLAFPGADLLASSVTGVFYFRAVARLRRPGGSPPGGNPRVGRVLPECGD